MFDEEFACGREDDSAGGDGAGREQDSAGDEGDDSGTGSERAVLQAPKEVLDRTPAQSPAGPKD